MQPRPCPKCGKESSNLRVCGFCQTPYPTDGSVQAAATRASKVIPSSGLPGEPQIAIEALLRLRRRIRPATVAKTGRARRKGRP